MKVLIINPPAVDNVRIVREGRCMQRQEAWGTSWAPLTLAIMAAILRDTGFTVDLKDCSNDGISFGGLKKIIEDFRPGLVIANTSTPSIVGDLKVAGLAKGVDKNIKTIFFGIHPTALPEEVFKENPDAEFIASGEPEYTVRDFALALRDNRPIGEVKGLIYKARSGIIRNEKRPFIENLDELPDPAWDLVDIKGYRLPITQRPFLLVLTGRGCPYACAFCAAGTFYGKKPRLRSPERIVSEMKRVKEKYGIKDFLFWSENAISERKQIYDISHGLAKDVPGVKWVCNGRVDMVDEELLKEMKKAGCWMIGYGIEAGREKVLRLMRKNITVKDMERAVALTKKAGIEVTGHVIVGFPGETKEDILETAKMAKKLDFDYIQVYCSVPFPGSALYEEAKKKGFIKSDDWAMFEQNFSVMDTPYLSSREVMELREKMIRDFYLDPRKIFKTLCKIRSPREVMFFLAFAARYFAAWAKLPETKEISSLDDPQTTLLHRDIIQKKPFLRRIYTDFYNRFKGTASDFPPGALLVELGSGGGFIKDVIPNVITSDILKLTGVD
ncbi:MAG: radical SAM protein, partial [Candidatus Omnitrophota bacterium]